MSKRVLIVDDDPAQRRILEETVKRFGFETKTCGSGEQAIQILESEGQGGIALVILDLVMPGIDGMAVLERIANRPGLPPIIVQTAHGSIDTAISAMRAGLHHARRCRDRRRQHQGLHHPTGRPVPADPGPGAGARALVRRARGG